MADAKTHRMKVYVNGKLTKDFPASLGKEVSGRYSHSGVHIVTEKKRSMTMDSTTFGLALDAGGYKVPVQFATRISNSGEFVHSAPWSVAQQGKQNVSHGCVNLSPADATVVLRDLPAGRRRAGHRDAGAADGKDTTSRTGRFRGANGVSDGTRTRDILDHNQVLYQLSYTHHCASRSIVAGSSPGSADEHLRGGLLGLARWSARAAARTPCCR